MQSREASHSSKSNQQSASVPVSNLFPTRPFGVPTQTESKTENTGLDEANEYSSHPSLDFSHIAVSAPGTPPPEPPPSPSPLILQSRLNIGKPGDKYEVEADKCASQVVNQINSPLFAPIQRQEISSPTESEPELQTSIQRQLSEFNLLNISVYQPGTTPPPPIQTVRAKSGDTKAAPVNIEDTIQSKRGSGEGLADNVREPMETAFDADFSGVKVHADGESDQLNKSLNAKAFATGQDIFFSQGAYNPGSRNGQELLAHELTHVVQQNSSVVQPKSLTKIARKENKIESKIAKNPPEQKEEDNESQVEKSTSQTSSPLDDNTDKTSQTVTAKSNKDSFKNVATNPTSRDGQLMLAHKLTHVNSRNANKINKLNVDNVVQTNLFNDTKKKIQNVSETVLGALAGEFNNDPSVTQIIIDGIISLIPILDQIADGRDIAAHIYFMTTKGEYNKIERWIGLAFSLLGCIPELGTAIKSASKLLFKGTGKVLPHLKELLQLISKILPNGTVNSFSSFLSQNWHKYAQRGITKWQEILNKLHGAVNLIPGILLQKKNQVLNKLKEIQGLSGTMLKRAFDTIWQKISKVLDDLASQLNHKRGKLNTNPNKWLSKHRDNVIKKYGADGVKMLSEGVIAKRVTKEGHTLKVLANGKIVRCSTCGELAKEFAQELADPKNSKLAEELSKLQKIATENPEAVVDGIKKLESQLQKTRLRPKPSQVEVKGTKEGQKTSDIFLETTYGKNAQTKFRKHVEQMRRLTGAEIGKVGTPEGQRQIYAMIDDIVRNGETRKIPWGEYKDALWSRKGNAIIIRQSNGEFVTFLDATKGKPAIVWK